MAAINAYLKKVTGSHLQREAPGAVQPFFDLYAIFAEAAVPARFGIYGSFK